MSGGPHLLDEKVVDCKLAVPQNLTEHVPLNAGGKKIFVGGVPQQLSSEDLYTQAAVLLRPPSNLTPP